MTRNVGTWDRVMRAVVGMASLVFAALAPWPARDERAVSRLHVTRRELPRLSPHGTLDLPSMNDALLAARGDDQALDELVRKYHSRVLRFGKAVCTSGADADDAVQEAFLKLSHRPDVAVHHGALAWLFTTVKRLCIRMLAPFNRRERLSHLGSDEAVVSDAHEALERFQLVARVHAAIATLPAELREVLVLREIEALSGAETAAALGLHEAAMKTRLHRARHALRETLMRGEFAAPSS